MSGECTSPNPWKINCQSADLDGMHLFQCISFLKEEDGEMVERSRRRSRVNAKDRKRRIEMMNFKCNQKKKKYVVLCCLPKVEKAH